MSSNPWIDREKRKNIGDSGRLSEKKTAKRLGARLTPASGAMSGAKGDMSRDAFHIEAKSTTSNSLGVSLDWLAKITREARTFGKFPALTVTFTKDNGDPVKRGRWVMIPEGVFEQLIEEE